MLFIDRKIAEKHNAVYGEKFTLKSPKSNTKAGLKALLRKWLFCGKCC